MVMDAIVRLPSKAGESPGTYVRQGNLLQGLVSEQEQEQEEQEGGGAPVPPPIP